MQIIEPGGVIDSQSSSVPAMHFSTHSAVARNNKRVGADILCYRSALNYANANYLAGDGGHAAELFCTCHAFLSTFIR